MIWAFLMGCSSSGEDTASLCNPVIPEGTEVILSSEEEVTINKKDAVLWICYGAKATVTGNNAQVYVDSGGELLLKGEDGTIWVENAATANVTAPGLTVYSEPNAEVQHVADLKDKLSCDIIQFNDVLIESPCP